MKYFLIFLISLTLISCSSGVHSYDLKKGGLDNKNISSVGDAMFADQVDRAIKKELKTLGPPSTWSSENWRDYWIHRCEQIHYSPGMGDSYIQYIIDKRREASLPEIPEIVNRQFRSEWQIFTDNVDKQTEREIHGFPPPAIVVDQTWVKTWSDYWNVTERLALHNSAVSTKGIQYINNHRKQAGLNPLE